MAQFLLATAFFQAFQSLDYRTMQSYYHDEATFYDPVFLTQDAAGVRAMWEMLLSQGTDMKLEFKVLEEDDHHAKVEWIARYTFTATGKKVVNHVTSAMEFKDGLIYKQRDHFDLWKWSGQALGASGKLLGWTGFLKTQIRDKARGNLAKYRQKKGI